jgi:hypothetical protein
MKFEGKNNFFPVLAAILDISAIFEFGKKTIDYKKN